MILSTWLDRPLSVAGRVSLEKDGEVVTRLVNVDRDLLVIPNVAIHMNRDMNKGVEYNPQIDMLPLYGEKENGKGFLATVAEAAGVEEKDILSYDLFCIPDKRYGNRRGRGVHSFSQTGRFAVRLFIYAGSHKRNPEGLYQLMSCI